MKMKVHFMLVFAGVLALGLMCRVGADSLPIGDISITGTTVAAHPELAGVVLEDVLTPYEFSGAGYYVKGVIQNRVVRTNVDGTLDFYWRIIPDPSSNGDIVAFKMAGFNGSVLGVNSRIDGLGDVAPKIARDSGGGFVNFLFPKPGVGHTHTSTFFFARTLATNYAKVGSYNLLCASLDCSSQPFTTFAPAVDEAVETSDFRSPVELRSIEPRSFFKSRELYHCSHQLGFSG